MKKFSPIKVYTSNQSLYYQPTFTREISTAHVKPCPENQLEPREKFQEIKHFRSWSAKYIKLTSLTWIEKDMESIPYYMENIMLFNLYGISLRKEMKSR